MFYLIKLISFETDFFRNDKLFFSGISKHSIILHHTIVTDLLVVTMPQPAQEVITEPLEKLTIKLSNTNAILFYISMQQFLLLIFDILICSQEIIYAVNLDITKLV